MLTSEAKSIFIGTAADCQTISSTASCLSNGCLQNKTTDMISKPIIMMTFRPANLIEQC